MLKILNSTFLALVTSLLPLLTLAQEPETKTSPFSALSYEKFLWGFRAGLNVTTPHFDDPDVRKLLDAQPSLGWTLGAVAQVKLTERYAFQAELGYTNKTSRFLYDNGGAENKMAMDFLDMSLLLRRRFNLNWGKSIHSDIFIGVGPNINYWLSAQGTLTTIDVEPAFDYNVVMDGTPDANYSNMYLNGVNRWLFGIDLGVGINAPISARQKIFLEFRATLGQTNLGTSSSTSFMNIVAFNGSTFQQNLLQQNLKTFSITAAYTFSFNYLESKKGHSTKDRLVKKKKPAKRKRR